MYNSAIILLLFLVNGLQLLQAQNLLPNPSFEAVNICQKYQEACSPKAWRSTLLKGFVYGEYLGENDPKAIVPPDGTRYVALRMYNKKRISDRTFIQVPFLCPLVQGQTYQLSFQYYSPVYALNQLGIMLIDSMLIYPNHDLLLGQVADLTIDFNPTAQAQIWHPTQLQFTAQGGEIGLIIGNFQTDEQTRFSALVKGKNLPNRIYHAF
ncbi:MAG: hypothetical protein AAGD05_04135, partial [Bacteroidota bacterium]